MMNKYFLLFVLGFFSILSCKEKSADSESFPIIYETSLKTEKIYFYDKQDFAAFIAASFNNAYDVGTFLREPELNLIWNKPDSRLQIYSSNNTSYPIIYESSVNLGSGKIGKLSLGEDNFSNAIPFKYYIRIKGDYGESTAEGWPIKEISLEMSLFEEVLLALLKENRDLINLKNIDFDDESSEELKNRLLENNGEFGMGDYVGSYQSANNGKLTFTFSKSCGNGRGVGCYGDGTFVIPTEG